MPFTDSTNQPEASTPLSQGRKLLPAPQQLSAPGELPPEMDLVQVLQQVSAMTMDPRLGTPRMQGTPPTHPLQTPQQQLQRQNYFQQQNQHPNANFTPEVVSHKFLPPPDQIAKRKSSSSPRLSGPKKSKSSAVTLAPADSRVFSAPPLPSSPELSVGNSRRELPPQFSPIANFRLTAPSETTNSLLPPPPPLQLGGHVAAAPRAVQLPRREQQPPAAPRAPPPTPGETTTATSAALPNPPAPPAMPWMDTPEEMGRKGVLAMNHLKMRKQRNRPGRGGGIGGSSSNGGLPLSSSSLFG